VVPVPRDVAAFDREKPIGVFGTPIEAAVAVEKAAAIKSGWVYYRMRESGHA
jgi:hypothetical protein